MINKLLLVRTAFVKADLLDKAGLSQLVKGDPIKVLPLAWSEEDKPSHYGYEMPNISRESLDKLNTFDQATEGTSVIDLGTSSVNDALQSYGLRVHPQG